MIDTIEKYVFYRLSNFADLISIVPASRIFPQVIPQNQEFPAIAYIKISGASDYLVEKNDELFQFSCYSSDYEEVKRIAKEVKKCWHKWRDEIDKIRIINSNFQSDLDAPFENELKLHHIPVTIQIVWDSNVSKQQEQSILPVHHWKLQETQPPPLSSPLDFGTNPIIGSNAACIVNNTGKIGLSYKFTQGLGSRILFPKEGITPGDNELLDTNNDFSISFWLNIFATNTSWLSHQIFSYYNNGINGIYLTASDNSKFFNLIMFDDNNNTTNIQTFNKFEYNEWNLISIIKVGNIVYIYFNNEIDRISNIIYENIIINEYMFFGRNNAISRTSNMFLEDIRLYEIAIDENERNRIWNDGEGTLS